jgi:DNA-binding SARP family transcriptional activator/GTPase SAR1 family protein
MTVEAPGIWIQLLGEFRVTLRESPEVLQKFRSRTAERLLASLALRLGHTVSKGELTDALWPESDGDRQSQNLRKALSDVRQVLETGPRAFVVVRGQGDRLWLDETHVETDVHKFKRLTDAGLEGNESEDKLRAALRLYAGPLLTGNDEPWLQVHRMELEERFGQAVEVMIALLLRLEKHEEALRIGRQAVVAAPLREDVHIALTRAYASAGLRSEAIRQFEELESILDNHWGETPSTKSVRLFEALWTEPADREPDASRDQKDVSCELAGGAVPAQSPFYIVRECDAVLKRSIGRSEGTILIHGPRQVGKTSLMYRVLNDRRVRKTRVVITDYQVLSRSQLASADSFSRALAYGFASQLGVRLNLPEIWNEWISPNTNLHAAVEAVLLQVQGPVVWAMDEADRLFGSEFADDFFGLVRSWHNLRAMDADGPFGRLTLLISYATEAHLFIEDINQSPFNVGVRIPIKDFDERETAELGRRYGIELPANELRSIWGLTGGQPFLTRKAFDALVHEGIDVKVLRSVARNEDGPFGEHLRRLLFVASRDQQMKDEVIRFLEDKPFLDPKTPLRLIAGGMLIRKPGGELDFRVPIYREFLTRFLLGHA